jgi:hypothetical protein
MTGKAKPAVNPSVIMEYNQIAFEYVDQAITRGRLPHESRANLMTAKMMLGIIDNHLTECGIKAKHRPDTKGR